LDETATGMGARLLRQWTFAAGERAEIEARLEAVEELKSHTVCARNSAQPCGCSGFGATGRARDFRCRFSARFDRTAGKSLTRIPLLRKYLENCPPRALLPCMRRWTSYPTFGNGSNRHWRMILPRWRPIRA